MPPAADGAARGLPVLVVDDSEVAGALTQQALRSLGWVPQGALSGGAALDLLQAALLSGPSESSEPTELTARSEPSAKASQSAAAAALRPFPFSVIFTDWRLADMDGCELARNIRTLAVQHQRVPPTIILVTASARESLANRSRQELASIDGFVCKPLTSEMLAESYAEGRKGLASERALLPSPRRRRPLAGMRILVVEDNLINQQIAEELLTQEGAIVAMAANGRLGVDAVAAAAPPYDAVLMDVQMPVMDGYSATREIRQTLGLQSLPIIAMTANAMAGDRDICLAAGMTEHVGKPFELPRLVALLLRLTGLSAAPEMTQIADAAGNAALDVSPEQGSVTNRPGLELATALSRLSGLRSMYVRTARDFCVVLETLPFEIENLVQSGDRAALSMQLHTLKGNAATLGAMPLAEKAADLERQLKALADTGLSSLTLRELNDEIAYARRLLQQAIVELSVPATAPASLPVALLAELAGLAAANDVTVLERHAENRAALESCGESFNRQLEQALQALDLDTVQQLCLDRVRQAKA